MKRRPSSTLPETHPMMPIFKKMAKEFAAKAHPIYKKLDWKWYSRTCASCQARVIAEGKPYPDDEVVPSEERLFTVALDCLCRVTHKGVSSSGSGGITARVFKAASGPKYSLIMEAVVIESTFYPPQRKRVRGAKS